MFYEFCTRTVQSSPIRKVSSTWHIPRICISRGGNWKGDILVADTEELEKIDASNLYPRRNAKEILPPQKGRQFYFRTGIW